MFDDDEDDAIILADDIANLAVEVVQIGADQGIGWTEDFVQVHVGDDVYVLCWFWDVPSHLEPMIAEANCGYIILRAKLAGVERDGSLVVHGIRNHAVYSTFEVARNAHVSNALMRFNVLKGQLDEAAYEMSISGDIKLLDRA